MATSTLELGIDVGDLDRVIQIDAPTTVASFLQRIGRTGRRTGSSRNALFLTTDKDALLRAAGAAGPVRPGLRRTGDAHPRCRSTCVAQQLLALTLQESDRGLPARTWTTWLGDPPVLGAEAMAHAPALLEHFLATRDPGRRPGHVGHGLPRVRRQVGRRHFLELTSAFVADPVLTVLQGRIEMGSVPDVALTTAFSSKKGPPMLLLAGRSWRIGHIDWKRRIVQVTPDEGHGTVRFEGSMIPQSYALCQAIAGVLSGEDPPVRLTARAADQLDTERTKLPNVRPGRTTVVHRPDGRAEWLTFAGLPRQPGARRPPRPTP